MIDDVDVVFGLGRLPHSLAIDFHHITWHDPGPELRNDAVERDPPLLQELVCSAAGAMPGLAEVFVDANAFGSLHVAKNGQAESVDHDPTPAAAIVECQHVYTRGRDHPCTGRCTWLKVRRNCPWASQSAPEAGKPSQATQDDEGFGPMTRA